MSHLSHQVDVRGRLLLLGSVLLFLGCGQAARTFFDLPPKAEQPRESSRAATTVVYSAPRVAAADTVRPEIENTLDADSALALLPRDHAGNIDWMAALHSGVINPREVIPGKADAHNVSAFRFDFDFFIAGPDSTFDAFFPHSSHTELIDCRQCHGRIFRYRNTPMTMPQILEGKYCGECHGKVAFPAATGCERCHPGLEIPADRVEPELIGDVVMARAHRDSATASGISVGDLPAATFPHWVHRIRYKCKTCHMELFEPRAGANLIQMADISAGKACGTCHNGKVAFRAGFGECQRCHIPSTDEPGAE